MEKCFNEIFCVILDSTVSANVFINVIAHFVRTMIRFMSLELVKFGKVCQRNEYFQKNYVNYGLTTLMIKSEKT